MAMTSEEMIKNHQEWVDKREARKIELEEKCNNLMDEQIKAIKSAYAALQEADGNLREMFDITIEDARAISTAETKMRMAFPHICIHPYWS
jgi:ribosomal protein S13